MEDHQKETLQEEHVHLAKECNVVMDAQQDNVSAGKLKRITGMHLKKSLDVQPLQPEC